MRRLILFLGCVLLFSSCASKKEQEERRENAFDVSGSYKALTSQGSDADFGFEIINETGRHDIRAVITRTSGLTDKEKELLKLNSIDEATVLNFLTGNNVFGQGYDPNRADGGENISTDFGESSEFAVCGPTRDYNTEYRIQYCLNGKIKKNENFIVGSLVLHVTRTQSVVENGKTTTKVTESEAPVHYRSKTNLVFYKQYLGSWTGEIFDVREEFHPQTAGLTQMWIQEVPENSRYYFSIPNVSTITYNGVTFQYSAALSSTPTSLIQGQDFPELNIVYSGSENRRLVFVGQIWSLGNLTGTLLWIDSTTQSELAHFRLRKN